jgi:hypothetical protein
MEASEQQDELRSRIGKQLADGLVTRTEPVPENSAELRAIINELHGLGDGDLEKKLVVSGFTDHPWGKDGQSCRQCIYYRPHRKWCALPSLSVPVEPQWWCRLWRI